MSTMSNWKILETGHNDTKIALTLALKFATVTEKHTNQLKITHREDAKAAVGQF